MLLHHRLARAVGVLREEVTTPVVAVAAHVEAGDLVLAGDRLDECPCVIHVGPAKAVDVVVPYREPAAELGRKQRQHRLDHARIGHGIHVGDGVLVAEIERARQLRELALDVAQGRHVEAMDEPEFPLGGVFQRIPNSFAVGLPQPFLFADPADIRRHALSGGDAETRQQRVRLDGLANAAAEILDGAGRAFVTGDAVLAFRSVQEDVPDEPVHVHAPSPSPVA